MSEEITIKTEVVKVDELQGREKQIYDYAYNKGVNDTVDENKVIIANTIAKCFFFIAIVVVVFIVFRDCGN